MTRGRALAGVVCSWILFFCAGSTRPVYDANGYLEFAAVWLSGAVPWHQGRGYATGLVWVPALAVARAANVEPYVGILLEGSFLMALLGWVILPNLPSRTPSLWARITCTLLLWILWGPWAGLSMTDIPAVVALFGALLLLRQERHLHFLASGLLVGLLYSLRPAYLLASATLVLVTCLGLRGWRGLLLGGTLLTGVALTLAPQGVLNVQYTQGWAEPRSFWPPTITAFAALVELQVGGASTVQRYETYLGGSGWPTPQLVACDPGGRKLLALTGGVPPKTITQYMHLLAADPILASGVLMRKVINAAWLDSRTPYIYDRAARALWLGALNVALVGLALLFLSAHTQGNWIPLLIALAASAPVLYTAPEQRFMMALSLLGIAYCWPALRWIVWDAEWGTRGRVLAAVALLVGLASAVATVTDAWESSVYFPVGSKMSCLELLSADTAARTSLVAPAAQ